MSAEMKYNFITKKGTCRCFGVYCRMGKIWNKSPASNAAK